MRFSPTNNSQENIKSITQPKYCSLHTRWELSHPFAYCLEMIGSCWVVVSHNRSDIRTTHTAVPVPDNIINARFPENIKNLYNICTMLGQRGRRWPNIVQMFWPNIVQMFYTNVLCLLGYSTIQLHPVTLTGYTSHTARISILYTFTPFLNRIIYIYVR